VSHRPMRNPGENAANLMYGDVDYGGTVDLFDLIDVQLVAAFVNNPIVGTDAAAFDRDLVVAANVSPANLPGLGEPGDAIPPGVESGGSATNIDNRVIDLFDAIDINLEAALVDQPVPGALIPGRNLVSLTDTVSLSCPILASRTLKRDTVYMVPNPGAPYNTVCQVGTQGAGTAVTLTIESGTRIVADSSTLVINRNATIIADGTLSEPILFTCRRPRPCPAGAWGGLYINGNAQVNNGTATSPSITGRQSGGGLEAVGEGNTGLYGGNSDTDNSGTLRFVVIQGGGTRFTATNERNGLTLQAVGSGTTIDYLQSVGGLDDGIEWFGGSANVRHAYVDNTQDDGFDWVGGWRGNLQFGIVRGCNNGCDNGIEADNFGIDGGAGDPEAAPRSAPKLANITLVGSSTPSTPSTGFHGMLLRQNTAAVIRNALVFDFKAALDIDSTGQATTPTTTTAGQICRMLGVAGSPSFPNATDSLSVRFAILGGSSSLATQQGDSLNPTAGTSNGDPDAADPRFAASGGGAGVPGFNCGGYFHDGGGTALANLEKEYIRRASNNIVDDVTRGTGAAAAFYLISAYATVPDFRPKTSQATAVGLRSGSTGCAIDPTTLGAFFRAAPYCGAVAPDANPATVNLPWYTGWTLPR